MIKKGDSSLYDNEPGIYPEYSDPFSKYADFVLAKKQWFSWEDQVLRQEMRKIIEETPFH